MENKSIKITQLTVGILFLSVGLLFLIVTLFAQLEDLYLTAGMAVFLILFIESSLWLISNSLEIDEDKLRGIERKNAVAEVAGAYAIYFRYRSLLSNIVFLLSIFILAAYVINLTMVGPARISGGIKLTPNFYIQIGIYLSWLIIFRRLFAGLYSKIRAQSRKNLPFYTLEPEGLILNIRMTIGGFRGLVAVVAFIVGTLTVFLPQPLQLYGMAIFILCFIFLFFVGGKVTLFPLKIKFSEIDEIRVLSILEAQSLMKYQIGPDASLVYRGAKDMYDYLKKNIERPNTYLISAIGANETLLIKGPHLFYFTSVENEDTSDLITAFNKYKATKGIS